MTVHVTKRPGRAGYTETEVTATAVASLFLFANVLNLAKPVKLFGVLVTSPAPSPPRYGRRPGWERVGAAAPPWHPPRRPSRPAERKSRRWLVTADHVPCPSPTWLGASGAVTVSHDPRRMRDGSECLRRRDADPAVGREHLATRRTDPSLP